MSKIIDVNVLNVLPLVSNRVRGYNTNEHLERFERFSGSYTPLLSTV